MADLSPAAQAMLDDYWEAFNAPLDGAIHRPLVAALRALAVRIKGADAIRQDILDIADELEAE